MLRFTMKLSLVLLLMCSGYTSTWAQDSTFVTIKAGSSIRETMPAKDIFLYPQFVTGTVTFKDGVNATALMNYNSLFDQVLFIDPKGDTLALKDEMTIDFVRLEQDSFYYNKGYIRLVTDKGVVKLAEKKTWEVADIRKIGSHDRPANGFSVTSFRTLTDGFGTTRDLILNEDLLLKKTTHYYFGDAYNQFIPASKKNLLLLFPKKQSMLANYLKENKINFNKAEDLQKLVQLLAQDL